MTPAFPVELAGEKQTPEFITRFLRLRAAEEKARLEDAAGDATGISAKIMMLVGVRTDHPLYGKTGVDMIVIGTDVNRL